jgi:hypothetical protein
MAAPREKAPDPDGFIGVLFSSCLGGGKGGLTWSNTTILSAQSAKSPFS